jgi:transcription elongation GreA/GreB family factor
MLAQTYLLSGEAVKAVELLSPLLERMSTDFDQLEIAQTLLMAFRQLQEDRECERILSKLSTEYAYNPRALLIRARDARQSGKPVTDSKELLEQAIQALSENDHSTIRVEIADELYELKEWILATSQYNIALDTKVITQQLQRFVVSLYNSRQFAEALRIACESRGYGKPIPAISEVEARILELKHDLRPARDLYSSLADVEPQNHWHRINQIRMEYFLRRLEDARAVLSRVKITDLKDDAMAMMAVAELHIVLNIDGALPFLYRAKQTAYDNPDIQAEYFTKFIIAADQTEIELQPTRVGIDCTVSLENQQRTATFTIVTNDDPRYSETEISADSDVAIRLLGKKVGDYVSFRSKEMGFLEELEYRIVAIQSKFVSAFQEIADSFSTRFPDHSGIQRVIARDNDLSGILAPVDARHKLVSLATHHYKGGRLSIGECSQLTGNTIAETWAALTSIYDGRIRAGDDDDKAVEAQARLLSTDPRIVLDITAALAIVYLQTEEAFLDEFSNLCVPQAVLDEVTSELAHGGYKSMVKMSLAKRDDNYVKQEYKAEDFAAWNDFLKRVERFLRSNRLTVLSSDFIEDIDPEAFDKLENTYGRVMIDPVMIAQDKGAVLYSDDLLLRRRASSSYSIRGVWTQPIIAKLLRAHSITEDQYSEAICKLALCNYFYLRTRSRDILWLLKKNDMRVSAEVTYVCRVIFSQECDPDAAVEVLAQLVKEVVVVPSMEHQKYFIVDFVLNVLVSGRPARRMLDRFTRVIRHKFQLLPVHLPDVLNRIAVWRRIRTLS